MEESFQGDPHLPDFDGVRASPIRCLDCVHFDYMYREDGILHVVCDLDDCRFKQKRESNVYVHLRETCAAEALEVDLKEYGWAETQ